MRYMTKEWYHTAQDSSFHLMMEEDCRAASYSDPYFRELYRQRQMEWLKLQSEACGYTHTAFDENLEQKKFAPGYRANKRLLQKRLPEAILQEVADIRVLALNRCTREVKEQIAAFCESNEQFVKQRMDDYRGYLQSARMDIDATLVENFCFHDDFVISSRKKGNDWIVIFEDAEERFSQVKQITFKDASVLKQDKRLCGACWLYEELYKTATGYEIHVLLIKGGLVDFIIQCSDVVLV